MAVVAVLHYLACADTTVDIDLPKHRGTSHQLCRTYVIKPEESESLIIPKYGTQKVEKRIYLIPYKSSCHQIIWDSEHGNRRWDWQVPLLLEMTGTSFYPMFLEICFRRIMILAANLMVTSANIFREDYLTVKVNVRGKTFRSSTLWAPQFSPRLGIIEYVTVVAHGCFLHCCTLH